MRDATPSMTALAVSLMRSIHSRSAPAPLISDPWGERLIPEAVVTAIGQSMFTAAGREPEQVSQADLDALLLASPAHANVIVRSRYTEDALLEAVARGATQYVLIGAGLDSYALRVPVAAEHLRIIEIDHPATQEFKRQRIAECNIELNDSVHFLSADLSSESLSSVLLDSPFDPDEPGFVSLLGVTMYLAPGENRALMREIASSCAAGSELVFTYIDQAMFTAPARESTDNFNNMKDQVASQGEPFVSGFDPASLARNLESVGLVLEEDLSDLALIERYDPAGLNELVSAEQSRIARARIAG